MRSILGARWRRSLGLVVLALAGLLAATGNALASPGCAMVNGKSGTLTLYGWVGLNSSSQYFNAGDKVTLTSSGNAADGRVQYVDSYVTINNDGAGTISHSATIGGSLTSYPAVQQPFGNATTSYSVACASIAPTLTGLGSASGSVGGTVTLTGTAFYGASAVKFGAVSTTSFTVNSATSITATVPSLAPGAYNVTVTTDAGTTSAVSYTVVPSPIVLVPASLPAPNFGAAYSQAIVATGGTAPYTYAFTGTLPVGLSLSSGGVLSGTPTATGSYSFTVTATDSSSGPGAPLTGSRAYTLTVNATVPGAPVIATATAGDTQASVVFSAPASNGGATITGYTVAASPGGTTGTGAAGPITVTGLTNGVAYTFTVTATNSAGTGAASAASNSVTPAGNQTITFGTQAGQTFAPNGGFDLNPVASASSGLPVTYSSQTSGVCTISGATVTMLSTGTCTIAAEQAGDAGHNAAATVTQSIAIGAGNQTITFGAQAGQAFVPNGTFALSPLASASSSLPVAYSSQTGGVCSISGTAVTMLSAGTCTIAADQSGDVNYNAAATVTQAIAISAATQAISFGAQAAQVFVPNGTFNLNPVASASSGLPVAYSSQATGVCSISGSTVTMLSAGTCKLTADQAGDANYSAAPQATRDVVIVQATPTLAWRDNLQKTVGESAFDLPDPTSNSTGGFTFTSSNPAVATVNGRTVTVIGPGVTTLVATQAAASSYTQGSVSITLTVSSRPDPTRDPGVAGGLQAQVDASVRFAVAQQHNIQDRLRQLRTAQGNPSSNAISVAQAAGPGLPLDVQANAADGQRPAATGWGVWTAGLITVGSRDGRGDDFDFRSDGLTFGADHRIGEHGLLGVAAGFGWDDADFDEARSNLDADQKSLSVYGLWRSSGHLFLDGVLGYGRLSYDIRRWSQDADATAGARRDGEQTFGALSFGYQHHGERMDLAGYGRLDASRTTLDGYRESGLGIYDLAYREQTVENSAVAMGLEGGHLFKTTGGMVRPHWLLEYRDALRNSGDAAINYVVQPVASDYLLGLRSYRESGWTVGAGLDMELTSGWQFSLLLRREQAAGTGDSNSIGLRVSYGSTAP